METLFVAVFGVFAAAVLRGFTGFGFGLAAVPLLSLALPPAKVVPFVVVLQVIVGVGGVRSAWRLCDWRAVGGLSPGLVLGMPIGLTVLTALRPDRCGWPSAASSLLGSDAVARISPAAQSVARADRSLSAWRPA